MEKDTTKKEVEQDYPDEETRKIVEDIEAEKRGEKEPEEEEDKKPEKDEDEAGDESESEEEPKKEEKEEDEGDKKPEKEEPKEKRSPKLIPLYQHEIEKKNWNKDKEVLLKQIEDLKVSNTGKTDNKKQEGIKAFAEKHGFTEDAVADLLALAGTSGLEKQLKEDLEKVKQERAEEEQKKIFDVEYEKTVDPLLDKDGVPADKRAKVKKLLNDLAFTSKYVGNDLDEIYIIAKNKGMLDNLGIVKGKKTFENSRGGTGKGADGEQKSIKEMSDKEFAEFSDKASDGYSDKIIISG